MTSAAAQGEEASPIVVPQFITTEWVIELQARLDQLTRNPSNLKWVLTKQVVRAILERAEGLLKNDSTLVEVRWGVQLGALHASAPAAASRRPLSSSVLQIKGGRLRVKQHRKRETPLAAGYGGCQSIACC